MLTILWLGYGKIMRSGHQLLAESAPRGVGVTIQKSLLDSRQQMVSQDTEKDVGLGAILQMMKDRAFHQGTLHGTKGCFTRVSSM